MADISRSRIFLLVGILVIAVAGVAYLYATGGLRGVLPALPTGPTPAPTAPTTPPGGQQQAGSETGAPVTNPVTGETVAVKCPADYCLNPVTGAGTCPEWTGKTGQAYTEEECYDYLDQGANLAECDKQRTIYYKICGVRQ